MNGDKPANDRRCGVEALFDIQPGRLHRQFGALEGNHVIQGLVKGAGRVPARQFVQTPGVRPASPE